MTPIFKLNESTGMLEEQPGMEEPNEFDYKGQKSNFRFQEDMLAYNRHLESLRKLTILSEHKEHFKAGVEYVEGKDIEVGGWTKKPFAVPKESVVAIPTAEQRYDIATAAVAYADERNGKQTTFFEIFKAGYESRLKNVNLKIDFKDCKEFDNSIPDEQRWLAIMPGISGMTATGSTKEEAFNEMMISLKVLVAYQSEIKLQQSPSPDARRVAVDIDKVYEKWRELDWDENTGDAFKNYLKQNYVLFHPSTGDKRSLTDLTDAECLEGTKILGIGGRNISDESIIYQFRELMKGIYNQQTNIPGMKWFKLCKYFESIGVNHLKNDKS